MKWFFGSKKKSPRSHRKENFCATIVALIAITLIYFSHDPSPAGANPNEVQFNSGDMGSDISSTPDFSAAKKGADSGELTGKNALLMQILLLEKGYRNIEAVPDYTATLHKQERIDGVLREPSFMQVKIRHEPFSVYMKWLEGEDPGREILYVEGENDNEMLIKLGGVKGRMMPTLKLDPNGDMAMAEARYPITTVGLKNAIDTILKFRYADMKNLKSLSCRMIDDQKFNKRDCFCFLMEFKNKQVSPNFRKSILYIDKENSLPSCIKNYAWAPDGQEELAGEELDKETLCEYYSFGNVVLEDRLAAIDFDDNNSNYQFRR
ncbi:MAG: DUF1571 domain-containing protein [Planctomycetaceae bacterium]|nr:DUF1571 domain-containing protein [Planctomycetaceae bacterium]